MRELSESECRILLKGAECGSLDLTAFSWFSASPPKLYYGECTKAVSGEIKWEAKRLPIVSKDVWESLLQEVPNPIVSISKDKRCELLMAVASGEIDETRFPEIFTDNSRPYMLDLVFTGFSVDEFYHQKDGVPKHPEQWETQFRSPLGKGEYGFPFVVFSHYNDGHLGDGYEEPWWSPPELMDYSTGKPLASLEEAVFYNTINSLSMFID